MKANVLRNHSPAEEVDYHFLMTHLSGYRHPRDKVTALLRSGDLIRVKKGLYVFGPELSREPYHLETLANLIYGPSYISLQFALSHYGMIPERPHVVTSVTNKRDKEFDTPVGRFTYRYLHPSKYPVGVTQIVLGKSHPVLIATPEKALADLLYFTKPSANSARELGAYLLDNLRIELSSIQAMDSLRLNGIAREMENDQVDLLARWVEEVR